MRFLLFPYGCVPFHGLSLTEGALGGVETGMIRLAEALDEIGHEVIVLSARHDIPPSKPRYVPFDSWKEIHQVDVLIVSRGWRGAFYPIPCKKRFVWMGDIETNPQTVGLGDLRVIEQLDGALFVSDWQTKRLCEASGFPLNKAWTLRNGIHLADFSGTEVKQRRRLIYSSQPQRGLIYLAPVFETLKRKYADLELHIFANAAVYDKQWPPTMGLDLDAQSILNLFSKTAGCFVHGTILQNRLAREFMKSALLAYPCNYPETSCITAMEAQAAGCAIVSTAIGALPETVGEAGILIGGLPQDKDYLPNFIEAVDTLLSDDQKFNCLSQNSLKQRHAFDWKSRANELSSYLKANHGMI